MTVRENVQVALASHRRRLFDLVSSTPRLAREDAAGCLISSAWLLTPSVPAASSLMAISSGWSLRFALANQPSFY